MIVTTNYVGGITNAIAYAVENDTTGYPIVLLSAGAYMGRGNRNITLTNDNILIYGTNTTAVLDGGGIVGATIRLFNITSGRPVIAGLIMKNGWHLYGGGAVNSINASPQIRNCVFLNNIASSTYYSSGGAIKISAGSPMIESCTFLNNYASRTGGAIYGGGTGNVRNCLLWGNSSGISGQQIESVLTITYSCIQGWTSSSDGNTFSDPDLMSSNSWVLASTNSSCWKTGNAINAMASDIDGELRTSSDLFVDIGADEFYGAVSQQGEPPTP